MADVRARTIDEIPFYRSTDDGSGVKVHMVGRDLGVTAWGMNVLAMDPGCTGHREHDHLQDGQEEVYVVLRGSGTLHTGSERLAITPGMFVRVGDAQKRKITPGPDGIVVLAIGGTPGEAYSPR